MTRFAVLAERAKALLGRCRRTRAAREIGRAHV